MPTSKQEYAAALREIADRFGALEAETIRRSIQLLVDMRQRLQAQLTTAETFNEFRLRQLTANVDDLVARYEAQLMALTNGSLQQSARLGALSVTEPLQAAGVTTVGFFQPTPAQINTLLDFSADLIRDISRQTRNAINTEIRLASLGERSTIDAMRRITDRLGAKAGTEVVEGVAARGESILRTEMGRVFNVSNLSQQQVTARSVRGLRKGWIATGDGRTRFTHITAHQRYKDNPIPIDEPFIVGGAALMHPLDPAGPAKETINCRCRMITIHPEIGRVGGPLDARVAKEIKRRRQEAVYA